ncbi:MAG: hypothetical protein MUP53_09500, partial [Bacteroidales bacterium]|nr:hypothetical protein [Bacteroidales bacterium]
VHPSETGVDYTWGKFTSVFMESPTLRLWNEASKITKAMNHRLSGEKTDSLTFAETMLKRIEELQVKAPFIDFSEEISYFKNIV